jgi:hypothetical protein
MIPLNYIFNNDYTLNKTKSKYKSGSCLPLLGLFFPEGHTVGALIHAGICLMSADQNSLQ